MNKNLKKLISAVAALAISASSVAAFAASFPDVAETASYKQAVDELVALEIINGFEDGTFGPDQNVTRAQITKMIVTALGDTAVQAAEAAAGRDTQFADVTANHWAAGYVATGTSATASNFINGYSETSFGPEDNVTYAQAVKMLVAALGYNSYAENEGGWPNGYLKYGYSLGLTEGVSGIGNDDPATRAQVAQMIDNALKCPICVTDGYENDAWGRPVPKLEVKDGSGYLYNTKDAYQNLLNYAHDSYLVYGRVTGTFRGGAVNEVGKVAFQVEASDNWKHFDWNVKDDGVDKIQVYKGEVANADDFLNIYSEAIIYEDENDEYTFVSLTPYGTTEQITLETDLFRGIVEDPTAKYSTLQMFKDYSKNKFDTYKIDKSGLKVFINGNEKTLSYAQLKDATQGYLNGNEGGTLVLIDETAAGKSTADGVYDTAMITMYAHTVVDYVEMDEDEAVIYFEASSNSAVDEFTIDFEDEDVEYNLTLNGEAITVEELQQYDVLSIAANDSDFSKATTFDVIVSRDTVEGQLRTTDTTDGEYTFDNGETYKLAWTGSGSAKLENGVSYTLYLNAFGKVAYAEELASAKKYAVVHNVYETTGSDEYYAVVITAEGKVTYLLKDKAAADILADVVAPGKTVDTLDGATKAAVQNRVIEYSINTKGELIAKNQVKTGADYTVTGTPINGDFKASKGKLDSEYVSEAITTFVDLEQYVADNTKTPNAMTYASLVDGSEYAGYTFGEVGTDDIAQFVVITSGMGGLNVNSPMAIYVSGGQQSIDGQDVEAITAYVNGELTTLVDDDTTYNMNAGDAFFYTLDSDGYIDDLYPVLTRDVDTVYDDFYTAAITSKFDLVDTKLATGFTVETTDDTSSTIKFNKPGDVKSGCELVFGAIVDASNGDVSIATKIADANNFNVNTTVEYDVADDAAIYKYDYGTYKAKNRVEKAASAAFKYTIPEAAFDSTNDDILDFESDKLLQNASNWTNANYGRIRLAVLKVVDDEVVEAIIYIPSTSKD